MSDESKPKATIETLAYELFEIRKHIEQRKIRSDRAGATMMSFGAAIIAVGILATGEIASALGILLLVLGIAKSVEK